MGEFLSSLLARRIEQGIVNASSGEFKSPRLPSPQDWVLVLEAKE
jgi:hypothetical protein